MLDSYISDSVHGTHPDPEIEEADEGKADNGHGIPDGDDPALLDDDAPKDANSEYQVRNHKHHFGDHIQVTPHNN